MLRQVIVIDEQITAKEVQARMLKGSLYVALDAQAALRFWPFVWCPVLLLLSALAYASAGCAAAAARRRARLPQGSSIWG